MKYLGWTMIILGGILSLSAGIFAFGYGIMLLTGYSDGTIRGDLVLRYLIFIAIGMVVSGASGLLLCFPGIVIKEEGDDVYN